MRRLSSLIFVASLACNRTDAASTAGSAHVQPTGERAMPTHVTPAAREKSDASAVEVPSERPAPTAAERPRCVIPLASEPPARAAKAETCPRDPAGPLALAKGYVTFPDAPGSPRIDVELAEDPAQKQRGLMYRTELPEQQGMLFSWNDDEVRTFWMRNTCIPLDMMFVDRDGFIAGILEEVPTMNDAPRSIPCKAAHVLEVNGGWSRAHGVSPGQRIIIER